MQKSGLKPYYLHFIFLIVVLPLIILIIYNFLYDDLINSSDIINFLLQMPKTFNFRKGKKSREISSAETVSSAVPSNNGACKEKCGSKPTVSSQSKRPASAVNPQPASKSNPKVDRNKMRLDLKKESVKSQKKVNPSLNGEEDVLPPWIPKPKKSSSFLLSGSSQGRLVSEEFDAMSLASFNSTKATINTNISTPSSLSTDDMEAVSVTSSVFDSPDFQIGLPGIIFTEQPLIPDLRWNFRSDCSHVA